MGAVGALLTLLLISIGRCGTRDVPDPAIAIVAASLGPDRLGIHASALQAVPNPKGEGTFVYFPSVGHASSTFSVTG